MEETTTTVPSPLASSLGSRALGDVEGAEDVRLVHGAPLLRVAGGDRVGAERAAGVVDEHADGPEGGGELVDGGPVGHVERVGGGRVAGRGELLGQRLDAVLAAGGEDDAVPGLGEPAGRGGADAAARTRDDGDTGGGGRCGGGHGLLLGRRDGRAVRSAPSRQHRRARPGAAVAGVSRCAGPT
ncbi:hypothetical protein RKD26_002855 [Streptomyces calvus]